MPTVSCRTARGLRVVRAGSIIFDLPPGHGAAGRGQQVCTPGRRQWIDPEIRWRPRSAGSAGHHGGRHGGARIRGRRARGPAHRPRQRAPDDGERGARLAGAGAHLHAHADEPAARRDSRRRRRAGIQVLGRRRHLAHQCAPAAARAHHLFSQPDGSAGLAPRAAGDDRDLPRPHRRRARIRKPCRRARPARRTRGPGLPHRAGSPGQRLQARECRACAPHPGTQGGRVRDRDRRRRRGHGRRPGRRARRVRPLRHRDHARAGVTSRRRADPGQRPGDGDARAVILPGHGTHRAGARL